MCRLICGFLVFMVAACLSPGLSRADDALEVDLELVLAVDISFSMDPEELALQRQGYIEAIRSSEVHKVIGQGLLGRIAIAYVEWAGTHEQRLVVPFHLVDGRTSADILADKIAAEPIRRAYRTSISGAIDFSARLFGTGGFKGARRVIDVSGDGPNNNGRPVLAARDEALDKGIVINGLPVVLKRGGLGDVEDLDDYYRDCVIGGPNAFVIAIREREKFAEAIRQKILLEIADLMPQAPRVIPAQYTHKSRPDCLVGERQWRERWEKN
jgi:hypothetical protein